MQACLHHIKKSTEYIGMIFIIYKSYYRNDILTVFPHFEHYIYYNIYFKGESFKRVSCWIPQKKKHIVF